MKRVFKYELPFEDSFGIDLPRGAEILSVQVQSGRPQLWAMVDQGRPMERRYFEVRGTGHELGDVGAFVATIQLHELVFHIFEAATAK